MKANLIPIGRVVKTHGVKGKVKVEYYGEDLQRFSLYRKIFIGQGKDKLEPYEVMESIPQPPRLILHLKGIEKVEEAKLFLGKEIFIEREDLPKLERGEYYWIDLLGLEVETMEGKRIGRVKEIFPTKAHDIYLIKRKGKEIFLPATEAVIQEVDLQKGVIKVNQIDEFLED